MRTRLRGTSKCSARNATSAAFAAPSTGGAASRTTRRPSRSPPNSLFLARGITRMSRTSIIPCAGSADDLPEHGTLFAFELILLAHEIERVAQRLDRRFDRGFRVFALQLEAVDFALHVLDAQLRFVEEDRRTILCRTDEASCLFFGVRLDVVRELLRRHQSDLQVLFRFAVLGEHRLHARHVLPQAVRFA